jgi:hypothetical protein
MSIFHGGWDNLVALLTRNPKHKGRVRSYDISAMEASISVWLFQMLYAWRHAAISGNDKAKAWFEQNKIFSLVLDVFGRLGMKVGANPSGCVNTLTDNTMVVIFILLYNLCCQTDSITQVLEWYEELPVKCMGDDTVVADDELWDPLEANSHSLGFVLTKEHEPCHISQAKFLNFGFKWDHIRSMYIFEPNYDKMFSGLFFHRKGNSWRLTLAKLYALRVMCYANVERRMELESYIAYVWNEHETAMRQETQLDDKLPFASLRSMHLRDDEVLFLLYGLESAGSIPILDDHYDLMCIQFRELCEFRLSFDQ